MRDPERAGVLLRELRHARGWSWRAEAEVLRSRAGDLGCQRVAAASPARIARSIARWESGRYGHRPGEQYQRILAAAFADNPGDLDRLLAALAAFGVPGERLAVLRARALPAAEVGAQEAAPYDLETVDARARHLRALPGHVPFARIQQLLVPLTERFRALERRAPSHDDLPVALARHLRFAGRVAFELHDDVGAERAYEEATALAATDAGLLASTLTSHALVTVHAAQATGKATLLAASAGRAAARSGDRSAVARALAVAAEIAARRGDLLAAHVLLDRAAVEVDRVGQGSGFGHRHLGGFDGLIALLEGRSRSAAEQLAAAALQLSAEPVQRGIVLADLSAAQIGAGAADEGARTLAACADVVAVGRGRVALQRIHRTRRRLGPWTAERFVRDLDDHLMGTVLT